MTNTKSTKRALLVSVMAMVICFTMLLGTTFAWFTDTAKSGNNIIKSGNLEVQFDYWNGTAWTTAETIETIFDKDALWEPGYTDVVYVRVTNVGSLAFNYSFNINFTETEGVNLESQPIKLSDHILYNVTEIAAADIDSKVISTARPDTSAGTKISAGNFSTPDELLAGGVAYFEIVVFMPTTVGNEANHETGEQPSITFYLNVLANQKAYEEDHFDETYDDAAPEL